MHTRIYIGESNIIFMHPNEVPGAKGFRDYVCVTIVLYIFDGNLDEDRNIDVTKVVDIFLK